MQRFQNILVPVDITAEGDPALQRAADPGKKHGAALKLVDVVDEVPRYADLLDLQDSVLEARRENLEQLAAPLESEGIKISTEVLVGAPAYEVTREVLRNGHDLVMRTSRVEGFVQRIFFGTLAMRLMRICPCPVWVVQTEHDRPYQRIAAAVDPFPEDAERWKLDLKILDLASSLSQQEESELHIVHAWHVYGEGASEREAITFDVTDYVSRIRSEAAQAVQELVAESRTNIAEKRIHLVKGPASEAVPRFAHEKNIELLVMGTVARTGVSGFLIGNTAERILHQVDCSLLAVKPDGFISPVELPETDSQHAK